MVVTSPAKAELSGPQELAVCGFSPGWPWRRTLLPHSLHRSIIALRWVDGWQKNAHDTTKGKSLIIKNLLSVEVEDDFLNKPHFV
jgi:hypothetical protein